MDRDYKIFVSIADIHIGVKHIKPDEMKRQLKTQFFDVVNKFPVLDAIFILGDILHSIVSLNSNYSNLYLWFIDRVYKLARKKNATVVIIKGTQSHDNDQLSNIKSYTINDDNVDFRIYETAQEITIWDDYNVLVLPDVKPESKTEMDERFYTHHKYDIILGHGVVDSMSFFVQESEHMSMKTYVYDIDKMRNSCKGPIMFGHIHQYQQIRDQFYYAGPFTLLERGGINAGFLVGAIYDKDRTKFRIEQYVNTEAASYFDFNITKSIIDDNSVEDIIEVIDELIEPAKENDLITLRITRGDSTESVDKMMILETRYRKDPRISIVKKIKTKAEEESEVKNKELTDKFSYIMDNNQTVSEIMYKYYQEEMVPAMPDKSQAAARISVDDFKRILCEQYKRVLLHLGYR